MAKRFRLKDIDFSKKYHDPFYNELLTIFKPYRRMNHKKRKLETVFNGTIEHPANEFLKKESFYGWTAKNLKDWLTVAAANSEEQG